MFSLLFPHIWQRPSLFVNIYYFGPRLLFADLHDGSYILFVTVVVVCVEVCSPGVVSPLPALCTKYSAPGKLAPRSQLREETWGCMGRSSFSTPSRKSKWHDDTPRSQPITH